MQTTPRLGYNAVFQAIIQRLVQAGVADEQAKIEAEIMLEADLHGVPSHGIRMLPNLLTALANGRLSATAKVQTLREFGAISVIDCGNGTGRYAAATAMDTAIKHAEKLGVGVCLAKNTSHWGRGHAYASRAAMRGYIGICTTNAIPTMAGWGARSRVLGNNPLAIGIPGFVANEPIVLDMAMSQAAVGKIATMQREGHENTENLGFDNQGNLSANPQAILDGAVTPMGAHKGAGLSLMIELLTAALAGAEFCYQLVANGPNTVDSNASKLFIALNLRAFIEPEAFTLKTEELINYLRAEASPFKFPGERGWNARKENIAKGVPIHQDILDDLLASGIDFSHCVL